MKTKIKRLCACGCRQITGPGKRWIHGHNQHGIKASKETKLKMSLSHLKCNPNRQYCDAWYDKEYRDDLRKDYCENRDCEGGCKRLGDHHINLNKKDCHPSNIMTLCTSCHSTLHQRLGQGENHKHYSIVIRAKRIIYIHKGIKKTIHLRLRKEANYDTI